MGADSYVVSALLRMGKSYRGVVYSAWSYFSGFPYSVRSNIGEFVKKGGRIDWGMVQKDATRQEVIAGLLGRNRKLAENSDALVAYLYGESRGTMYTIKQAVKKNIPVTVFVCDEGNHFNLSNIGNQTRLIKLSPISVQSQLK